MASSRLELCWGTVRGAALPEMVEIACRAGFGAITVAPMLYFDAVRDGFSDRELAQRLSDSGVVVSIIDPLTSGLPGIASTDNVAPHLRPLVGFSEEDCYRAANALGASTINVAHFLGVPLPQQVMVDSVGAIAERAAGRGLSIAIEFIPGTGFTDAHQVVDLIDKIGASNVGIMFDTWHFYRSGGSLEDLHQSPEIAAAVIGLQLNDASPDALGGPYVPGVDRLIPGDGVLPLREIVQLLLVAQADLRLGVEVFSPQLRRGSPLDAAIAVAETMRRILPGLG